MILRNIEKHVDNGNLEDIRGYMLGMYNEKYIEEMVAMLAILSQINLILEIFYFRQQNFDLRKCLLAWLEVSNTKPEVDTQQYLDV